MRTLTILTLLLATWLLFAGLGDRELYSSHEARAAMNAASLLEGATLPCLLDGTTDVQKPPLYYHMVAFIGQFTGVDAWAVRLPAALSGLTLIALMLAVGWYVQRPIVGLYAALVLTLTIHFPWLARIGRIDMPLALCVSLAGVAFVLALRGQRGWLWVAYPACALGVLLKGPIGLALPGAIVVALLTAEGRWPAVWEWSAWRQVFRELAVVPGLSLVGLVVVPYFLWLDAVTEGRFLHEFFWLHNVQRGFGGSRLRAHPVWLYVPYLALYLLPATPLLVVGLISRVWRDPLARAGLAWMVGVVVLLSLSRFKRADYLLPAYPGAALLIGCWLERCLGYRPKLVITGTVVVVCVSVLSWAYYLHAYLPADAPYREYRPLAALIREQNEPVVYFRAEAHALMFRVGQKTCSVVDWDELRQRRPKLIVTPAKVVAEVRQELGEVEVVGGTVSLAGGKHERPLVLLRVIPSASAPRTCHRSEPQSPAP